MYKGLYLMPQLVAQTPESYQLSISTVLDSLSTQKKLEQTKFQSGTLCTSCELDQSCMTFR